MLTLMADEKKKKELAMKLHLEKHRNKGGKAQSIVAQSF
jgi:hypothetical protein